ncbi:unnamed protein product, partial [Rotaria sp. Silwood1]
QLSTTSEMTRDLNMLHNAYKQNLKSTPTTRTSRTHTVDSNKKIQQQKPISNKRCNNTLFSISKTTIEF